MFKLSFPARLLAYTLPLWISPLSCLKAGEVDRKEILKSIERVVAKQKAVEDELEALKRLLGVHSAIDKLELIEPEASMGERVRVRLEDGIKAYKNKQYDRAKESFQTAWEEDPNHFITNFNLAMAYQRQGNTALAKRMFKSVLELRPRFEHADAVNAYLKGGAAVASEETKNDGLKGAKTELTNLQKEVDSYMRSTSLSEPKRRASVVRTLKTMQAKAQEHKELAQEYLMGIAERYNEIECFAQAIEVYSAYEENMEGKVLPDEYYSKLLSVQEKQKARDEVLNSYIGNAPDQSIRRLVGRDQEELSIFASQISEFVQTPSMEDTDFLKISRRLGEYRWGGKSRRHVIMVNRYEELLYSSLEGTQPLDRYKDGEGQTFLQNITQLSDKMSLKDEGYIEVDLFVKGELVPYCVLFSYIPKHESFIIVRYPKKDVS